MIFAILLQRWLGYRVEIRSGHATAHVAWAVLPATSLDSARALVPRRYVGVRRRPPGPDGVIELWGPSAAYLAAARSA